MVEDGLQQKPLASTCMLIYVCALQPLKLKDLKKNKHLIFCISCLKCGLIGRKKRTPSMGLSIQRPKAEGNPIEL